MLASESLTRGGCDHAGSRQLLHESRCRFTLHVAMPTLPISRTTPREESAVPTYRERVLVARGHLAGGPGMVE
jgi:hypothetical protein